MLVNWRQKPPLFWTGASGGKMEFLKEHYDFQEGSARGGCSGTYEESAGRQNLPATQPGQQGSTSLQVWNLMVTLDDVVFCNAE